MPPALFALLAWPLLPVLRRVRPGQRDAILGSALAHVAEDRRDLSLPIPAFAFAGTMLLNMAAMYWDAAPSWGLTLVGCVIGATVGKWVSILLTAWRIRPQVSVEVRHRAICPACGYDLRATPNRCPECGADSTPTQGC